MLNAKTKRKKEKVGSHESRETKQGDGKNERRVAQCKISLLCLRCIAPFGEQRKGKDRNDDRLHFFLKLFASFSETVAAGPRISFREKETKREEEQPSRSYERETTKFSSLFFCSLFSPVSRIIFHPCPRNQAAHPVSPRISIPDFPPAILRVLFLYFNLPAQIPYSSSPHLSPPSLCLSLGPRAKKADLAEKAKGEEKKKRKFALRATFFPSAEAARDKRAQWV